MPKLFEQILNALCRNSVAARGIFANGVTIRILITAIIRKKTTAVFRCRFSVVPTSMRRTQQWPPAVLAAKNASPPFNSLAVVSGQGVAKPSINCGIDTVHFVQIVGSQIF